MAFLVSVVGFSLPLSTSCPTSSFLKFLSDFRTSFGVLQERTPRNLALVRHFRQRNYRTATVLSAFYGLTDAAKNPIPRQRGLMPQRNVVACRTNVGSCRTHDIFSGYWVGPDVEDGWGFVVAFVNRI